MPDLLFTQSSPDGAGVITAEPTGEIYAHALGGNPLADGWPERARFHELISSTSPTRVVVWSGTNAEELFAPDPTSWMPAGRERFERFVDAALDSMSDGVRLLVRTHARHVLSDIPTVRTFATGREDAPVGVLLDPASMLEPSMIDHADDHLERIASGALRGADAVLVAGLRRSGALGGETELCELERGELDASAYARFTQADACPAIRFARADRPS